MVFSNLAIALTLMGSFASIENVRASPSSAAEEFFEIQRDRERTNYKARLSPDGTLTVTNGNKQPETRVVQKDLFRLIEGWSARLYDMPETIEYSKSNCDIRIFPASKYQITLGFRAEVTTKTWDQECRGFVADFRYNNFIEMVEAVLNLPQAREPWEGRKGASAECKP